MSTGVSTVGMVSEKDGLGLPRSSERGKGGVTGSGARICG